MKMRTLIALCAAAAMMTGMTANVYADTLETRDGLKYRISDNGEDMGLYSGWTSRDGKRYYYKDGEMKRNCWLTSGGEKKYYLTGSGEAATGKLTVDGVEYEFDERGKVVPDKWGLTLTAKDVTPTGCTLEFIQSGGSPTGELFTGTYYSLEIYKNGEWTAAEMLPQEYDIAWPAVAWPIEANCSADFEENWQWLYGDLAPGKYRIGKQVTDFRRTADYDEKMYYAYFEIE